MFNTKLKQERDQQARKIAEQQAVLAALDRSSAVIEFTPDGIIQTANQNFLNTVGYRLDEIQGKHQ